MNVDVAPSYLHELLRAGLLIETGVDGLYGRSGMFEDVVDRLDALITRAGRDENAEVIRFPPAMTRRDFETTGYMRNFPQLAGTVHCFCGDDAAHRELVRRLECKEAWTEGQQASEIVLTPAACYPLYPVMARRGPLSAGGKVVDLLSYCFRHEPSQDPSRMQLFRMREYVRFGTGAEVQAFREKWMERARGMVDALGLPGELDVANDPFFGRAGRIMASSQREQALKLELLIPMEAGGRKVACFSFNYHQDSFGKTWGIETHDGAVAHTGCVGFGMERITLALFRHHGLDTAGWPPAVRARLWG